MYQGKSETATPRNKNIYRGPSRRPKGMGRRNPPCGIFTRKGNHDHSKKTELAKRLKAKMDALLGKQLPPKKSVSSNPFEGLINKLLTFNKKDK